MLVQTGVSTLVYVKAVPLTSLNDNSLYNSVSPKPVRNTRLGSQRQAGAIRSLPELLKSANYKSTGVESLSL
ncbi:hypothetical protein E2C01_043584 [Portunus trituberculatus]|uniref:Uncharacterized protein n=1 Tax=Portunus trituberculatus TaxID=210409 RepID=A0A5B7FPV2_PORTR|nr:hypothetical protein [Portunus trituberculatus]